VALRPRLSPGVPLSRDGSPELHSGTGAVKHQRRRTGTGFPRVELLTRPAPVAPVRSTTRRAAFVTIEIGPVPWERRRPGWKSPGLVRCGYAFAAAAGMAVSSASSRAVARSCMPGMTWL
jgi:hypothetical protein